VVLQVSGLTASAPDGTVLLDDVGFRVRPGWLVAVMGPTGAGKTSLLNALAGSLATDAGTIRMGGRALGTEPGGAERRIAFVPQDDVLHPQLTLGRTLAYAASLRLPPDVGGTGRHERVAAVLSELGLTEHAFQPISTLSGGQRRRAGVAVELMGDPDVLVLDEPTSGLDPGAERSVLQMLRGLADRGRTVLAVTHSVQALAVCDRVLFLAPGGQVAFYGPPAAAQAFFRGASPAEVFTRLRSQPGPSAKDRFRASPTYARYVDRLGLGSGRAGARRGRRPLGRFSSTYSPCDSTTLPSWAPASRRSRARG
jgi:ABC-type multidrug transport system ATPase subunit